MFAAKAKVARLKSAGAVDQDEAAMSSNQPKQQRRVKTREELAELRKQMMKRPSQAVGPEGSKSESKQETEALPQQQTDNIITVATTTPGSNMQS